MGQVRARGKVGDGVVEGQGGPGWGSGWGRPHQWAEGIPLPVKVRPGVLTLVGRGDRAPGEG